MEDSKSKWNRKYQERLAMLAEPKPNKRLEKVAASLIGGGEALELACGLGGNSLYLAKKGYEVEAHDISDVAIGQLRNIACKEQLSIQSFITDLEAWDDFSQKTFDIVVITYYLDRMLLSRIKPIIKEKGYFFMETYYNSPQTDKLSISEKYRLRPQELLNEFIDWQILYYEEAETEGRQTIFCRRG